MAELSGNKIRNQEHCGGGEAPQLFGSPDACLAQGTFPFLTEQLSTTVYLPWLLRVVSHCVSGTLSSIREQSLPAIHCSCYIDLLG